MRLVTAVREGSYAFHGVSETHDDATARAGGSCSSGKFTERACAVSMLLDAYFGASTQADDLDWIALLASCAAFDSYSKVFTADLQPDRIAELLLVHPEFPYSVRYSVERMYVSLKAITAQSTGRHAGAHRPARSAGSRSSLAFATVGELLAGDLHAFLNGVLDQCRGPARGRARCLYRLSDRDRVRELNAAGIRVPLFRCSTPSVTSPAYRYSRPVWQSIMEVRMHPRTDQAQRCFTFQLSVNPKARIFSFVDYLGNHVHHFDLPAHHRELTIVADALVNLDPPDPLPSALPVNAWQELDRHDPARATSGRCCFPANTRDPARSWMISPVSCGSPSGTGATR